MKRWLIPCLCGCGGMIQNFDRDGKPLRYLLGHNWTPELSRLGAAASVANPNFKKLRSEAGKKSWRNPAYRERMAASVQRQWADPNFKEKTLSSAHRGIKRKWAKDPSYRNKMRAIGREQMALLRQNKEAMLRSSQAQTNGFMSSGKLQNG